MRTQLSGVVVVVVVGLNLEANKIRDEGVAALAQHVPRSHSLAFLFLQVCRHLCLRGNIRFDVMALLFFKLLFSHLILLCAKYNRIGDEDLEVGAEFVQVTFFSSFIISPLLFIFF